MFPIYVLIRTWRDGSLWRDRAWWTGIAVSAAVALVVMGPFLFQMLRLSGSGAIRRPITEMQSWALNFYDPFLPNLRHPLWGEAAGRWFPKQRALWPEKVHALGFVAMALGLTGLLSWRRRQPLVIAALGAVWIASYAISLGPVLQSGDERIACGTARDRGGLGARPHAEDARVDSRRACRSPCRRFSSTSSCR